MTGFMHVVVLAAGLACASADVATAGQARPNRQNDQQVDQLLKRIGQKTNQLDKSLDRVVDRDRRDDRQSRDQLHRLVTDLEEATDRLRDRVKGRQSTTLDVEDVLRRGASVDDFLQRSPLSGRPQQHWISLRSDLDALARAYNVSWTSSPPRYASARPGAAFRYQLTGTYQLEISQNEDPRRAAEQAARSVPADQRTRMVQRLLRRLEAPDLVAFERRDERVTMASTRGPRVTVDADGRDHPEPWSADRTMHTRATLEGERLMVVTTTGSRGSDFSVTFEPIDDGRRLRMTRTLDDEALRQPVTVRSTYRRLSDEPRWADIDVRDRREPSDDSGPAASVEGVVPDGTRLVAVLDNGLSTTDARDGESLAMTIHSPSRYEGGVITGVVSTTDDRASWGGRAGMTLTLTGIRLRDGRSHRFDGTIEEMRTPDGDTVRVDREGTVATRDSQGREAVERGAMGAVLGAIIGAVAGGGKGAAIGAVIGAGGGAGTVIITGRDRLDLPRGTEVTITARDPWTS